MYKLLQINITANWGSTGKIAETIGLAAMNNGWDSYIAFGGSCNKSQSKLLRVGNRYNRYLHYIEQRISDNEGLCSRNATNRLIQQIKVIRPDIVQLHNIHDHYINYKFLFEYLNKTDIKVVWTFHDCWAFTGHCMHFVTANCYKWKTGCFDCPLKNEYPKSLLDKSKRNYDLKKRMFDGCNNLTIVPCSDWMANFVRQSFLKDKRIEVIKNGVDLNVFKPIRKDDKNFYSVLAVSSVWHKEKGLFDIFKIKNLLPENYQITIVGLSAKQIDKLPSGIIGIQRTQNVQELVTLYSDADVLINPTYADTFPTINLEALACGTPVITYKTGGSPEAIDDKTGVAVEQGDLNGMAKAIETICGKDRQEFAIACRERAMNLFDKNKCFEKYIELYNSLIRQ